MAATYASSSGAAAGGNSATVTKAALGTPAAGDLLVAFCWSNAGVTTTWTPPASEGWLSGAADTSASVTSAIFYRLATGSEPTSWTFTRSTAGNASGLIIIRLTAGTFDPTTPVADSKVSFGAGSTTVVLAACTATVGNTELLQVATSTGVTGAVWTPPGTATSRAATTHSGTAAPYAIGDETVAAGSTGTRTWTHTVVGAARGGIVAINPPPVTLVVTDSSHAHGSDNVALTQVHALAVADSSHAHTVDTATLTQVHNLAVDDSSHAHTSENLTLEIPVTLVVADSSHSHSVENVALTQVHVLTVSDSSHAHGSDNVTLDTTSLSVNGTLAPVTGSIQLAPAITSEVNRAGAWVFDNIGTATWTPTVVPSPVIGPVNAVVAQAFTAPVIEGTHAIVTPTYVYEADHRDQIIVNGRDISFWRGVPTPPMDFQYVQPLGWAGGTLRLPQAVVPFEIPGSGDLSWLTKGASVVVQRVDTETEEVVRTDYRGFVLAFSMDGGELTVETAGHGVGRMTLQDRQMMLIQQRFDAGAHVRRALQAAKLQCSPRLGAVTGINLIRWGGGGLLDYFRELIAKMATVSGNQWTVMPTDAGVYETYLRDDETVHGTVYLDDARVKGDLRSDMSEEPTRVFASGVTPEGMVVKFGAYPGLIQAPAAPYPMNDNSSFGLGTVDTDTDTGDGITVMMWRLRTTGFLEVNYPLGTYDATTALAVKALQRRARLTASGTMNPNTWKALYNLSVTGYRLSDIRILPAAEDPSVQPWRLSSNGSIIAANPAYVPSSIPVDLTIAMGAGFTRAQIRLWAQGKLVTTAQWRGTIEINTGAIVAGEHTPGDPIASILRARDIRPGMNLWLPNFPGGLLVHVAGVSVSDDGHKVTLVVDTRPGDTMPVWAAIQRDRDNRNTVHRSFFAQRKSSTFDRENTFDEVGGMIEPIRLTPDNWKVFPVVAKQAGVIERIKLDLSPNREFVVAAFGRKISEARLRAVTNAPLTLAGRKRWTEENVYDRLDRDHVVLYVAGSDEDPAGYFPGRKSEDDSLTGRWDDPASFPFVTFSNETERGSVIWVAVWVGASSTLDGGRIMWPSAEEY